MVESFKGRPYAARRFQAIVDQARKTNPFYRRWIADPENPPLLDRATALEHNDEILNGHPVTGTTSGSIGVPLRFSQSAEWSQHSQADTRRFIASIGGQLPVARILHVHGRDPGPEMFPVTAPVDEQIEFILQRRRDAEIVAITTLPTNAELLSREIVERGIDMSFIERFGTYAETLQDHQKQSIQEAFPNARLWQTYSSMEFGMIAMPCPHEPDFFHIMAHRLGVEVLDDNDLPAPDGEPGRVYITDYVNSRSPLIRYELGDLVIRGKCPCGKIKLPALSRILGRVAGTLLHRNGRRILFVEVSIALREIPGMRQYQVIQNGIEEFTVTVVAPNNIDAEIREAFRVFMGYVPNHMQIEYVDLIPRAPNGKYQTSICKI